MKNQLKAKKEHFDEYSRQNVHLAGGCKCNGKCKVCKCTIHLTKKVVKK